MSDRFTLPESPMELEEERVLERYEDTWDEINPDASYLISKELNSHRIEYSGSRVSDPVNHDGKYPFIFYGCSDNPEYVTEGVVALFKQLDEEHGELPEIVVHRSCAFSVNDNVQAYSYTLFYKENKERGLYRISLTVKGFSTQRTAKLAETNKCIQISLAESNIHIGPIRVKPEREQ